MMFSTLRATGLISALSLALTLFAGCGEGESIDRAEAAEAMNESDNGLVKIADSEKRKVVAKYLTPRYLAAAETETRGFGNGALDSLTELYSKTMSFHVAVSERTMRATNLTPSRGINSGVTFEGVRDIESEREMFSLRCGDSLWHPVAVLPESRVGEADQLWFVVFAVDPRTIPKSQSTAVITYTPLNGEEEMPFTYKVEDFLHPEFIASIN